MTNSYSEDLAVWEARLDVTAVKVLPEIVYSPQVVSHIYSEGISV